MSHTEQPQPHNSDSVASTTNADAGPSSPTEPPADSTAEDVSVERKSRRAFRLVAGLGLVVAVAGLGWAAWDGYDLSARMGGAKPMASPAQAPAQADDPTTWQRQITALQDRIALLETRQTAASATADLSAMVNRLGGLENAVRALESQPKLPAALLNDFDEMRKTLTDLKRTSADAATVLRVLDRLDQVEKQINLLQSRKAGATALLLAVGQLRDAVQRSMPYDDEWRALQALAGQDPTLQRGLEALSSHRTSGLPSAAVLVNRFTVLAPSLIRADYLPEQKSWWQQSLDRVASLVVIRREDALAAGGSVAAVVARTEAALTRHDFAAAITELSALSPAAAALAADWLHDASARLRAEQALSDVTAHLVAATGAGQ